MLAGRKSVKRNYTGGPAKRDVVMLDMSRKGVKPKKYFTSFKSPECGDPCGQEEKIKLFPPAHPFHCSVIKDFLKIPITELLQRF